MSGISGRFHEKVDFYLHRPVVEYTVIFLIILDALLVTASLLIEIKIIEGEYLHVCMHPIMAVLQCTVALIFFTIQPTHLSLKDKFVLSLHRSFLCSVNV